MENVGVGAGLAALAFWGFIAAVVVAYYWDSIRKRDAQHETVRRVLESGQQLDQDLMDKLFSQGSSGSRHLDRDFKITALWILPVSPALAAFGVVYAPYEPKVLGPMLGISAMLALMGIGFWVAGKVVERWYRNGNGSTGN
jgi:hypothetical protein